MGLDIGIKRITRPNLSYSRSVLNLSVHCTDNEAQYVLIMRPRECTDNETPLVPIMTP